MSPCNRSLALQGFLVCVAICMWHTHTEPTRKQNASILISHHTKPASKAPYTASIMDVFAEDGSTADEIEAKFLVLVSCTFCCVFSLCWSGACYLLGAPWSAAFPFAVSLVWIVAIVRLSVTGKVAFARMMLCYGLVVVGMGLQSSLGGSHTHTAFTNWALLGPQLALVTGYIVQGVVCMCFVSMWGSWSVCVAQTPKVQGLMGGGEEGEGSLRGNVSAPGARQASFVTCALPVDCCRRYFGQHYMDLPLGPRDISRCFDLGWVWTFSYPR